MTVFFPHSSFIWEQRTVLPVLLKRGASVAANSEKATSLSYPVSEGWDTGHCLISGGHGPQPSLSQCFLFSHPGAPVLPGAWRECSNERHSSTHKSSTHLTFQSTAATHTNARGTPLSQTLNGGTQNWASRKRHIGDVRAVDWIELITRCDDNSLNWSQWIKHVNICWGKRPLKMTMRKPVHRKFNKKLSNKRHAQYK